MDLIPIEQQLLKILAERDFQKLENYKTPSSWTPLTLKERTLLATLFIAEGEMYLQQGDSKVLESFFLASQVSPENPEIFYHQAMIYSSKEGNLRCLSAAALALSTAVSLSPSFFDAWYAWGSILVRMGDLQGEATYYQEAHQKFTQAQIHSQNVDSSKLFILYWQWGVSWHLLGQLSGEAHDFYCALEKYRLASSASCQDVIFWNDYGNAVAELASLLGKKELFLEAIELFRKVVHMAEDHFNGWLSLGCAYQRVFEFDKEDIYFQLSNESFNRASELNPNFVDLWLNWGRLYAFFGKVNDELELLQKSCDKFFKANVCESNHPGVLSCWAESQMLWGTYDERLDLLREAEEKIVRSLELHPEAPDSWRIYGACLVELGRYFADESFYLKAIEKFRYGLSLNQRHALLWYGLSLAHFAIGDIRNDVPFLEESVRYCAKAMECGGQIVPQFWNDWGVALMRLAETTQDRGTLESAIEKFEHAIGGRDLSVILPDCDLEWLYNYACACDFLGDFTENVQDHERAVQILSHVIQQDPSYTNARYSFAVSLSHLGVLTDDAECLHRASGQFEILLYDEMEDETAWNDWGMCLLNLAYLTEDPSHSDNDHRDSDQHYHQAEEKLSHAIALGCTQAFYNLGCLYSLIGNYSASMHYIERAELAGVLPSIDDILNDDWLDGVRETAHFRNFIALLSHKQEQEK